MIMWAIKDITFDYDRFWSLKRTRTEAINDFLTDYPPFNTWPRCKSRGFRAVKVNVEEVK